MLGDLHVDCAVWFGSGLVGYRLGDSTLMQRRVSDQDTRWILRDR